MKIFYDLHIHSALSPCADNDMSLINIIAKASVAGIEMLAIADHNSIKNVKTAIKTGLYLGITVVPAMELQTSEDIHILCLFENFSDLEKFYNTLNFMPIENRPEIFGEQLVFDENGKIAETENRFLLSASDIAEYEVHNRVKSFNGVAIPAHVNREANGIVTSLGTVPENYKAIELSADCPTDIINNYTKDFKVILNSDSHCLDDIGKFLHIVDIENNTSKALLKYLNGDVN